MNRRNFAFAWLLNFLLNPVKFGVVDDNGGGSSDDGNQDDGKQGQMPPAGSKQDWTDPNSKKSDDGVDDGPENQDDGNKQKKVDLSTLDPAVQNYIKDLRKENAGYRTQARGFEEKLNNFQAGMKQALGIEDEDQVSPEEQVSFLSQQTESLSFQNAVLDIALENQMNRDQADYLTFLLGKQSESLEENEEISEEDFEALVAKAKGVSGGNNFNQGNSSVDGDGNNNPNAGKNGDPSVEEFSKMSFGDKSKLRQENPNLYTKLFAEANKQRMISYK